MAESAEDKTKRAGEIFRRLKKQFPHAGCPLTHRTPMQLLVATILSAQCTDKQVNKVTPALFEQCSTAEDFAGLSQARLEKLIHSTGFYRNKAKHIRQAAKTIVDEYDGVVPQTMDELLTLPGVARKTANCVLGNAFGKNEGITVDTHVLRIGKRLGLTSQKTPEKVERDLMELFPRKDWTLLSHLIIFHGRATCTARKPDCPHCCIREFCPSADAFD